MKISIFHATAGQGHKKIAEVIHRTLLDRGIASEDVTIDDSLDLTPWHFRKSYPSIYYYAVKHIPHAWGWFYEKLDHPKIDRWVRPVRSFFNSKNGAGILAKVLSEHPKVVISTHFFPPEVLGKAKLSGRVDAKLITVITDFYPHAFWINPGTDFYWVMSEEGKSALERWGVPAEKIFAGGIPVAPLFRPSGRKQEILKRWGFDPQRRTLLLTSGSFGFGPYEAILTELETFRDRIQCFMVCGNNRKLEKTLNRRTFGFPIKIFGFIDFMPDLMEASDLMIAKPGGSTTTESLVKGVPMIVLDPIPGQESRNANLLKERNAAFFMEKPEQIKVIFKLILSQPEILEYKRRQIQGLAKPYAADDLASFVLTGSPA